MKFNELKLTSSEKLVARTVAYVAFMEQHRGTFKDVPGNSKPVLADLETEAREVKPLIEKVDKAENEFLALRSELKARLRSLDEALTGAVHFAVEHAKQQRLAVIREGLRQFSHQRRQKRASADAAEKGEASKPAA